MTRQTDARPGDSWDHTSHEEFYNYYAKESESDSTLNRFRGTQKAVLHFAEQIGLSGPLDVADIGCGAGTQARLWAEVGHRVFGLDVNEPLVQLARERAAKSNLRIDFEVGSATALPWASLSMDVCLMPELLEHVPDWRSCLYEAARVLRPGGLLYLSTTNYLCPLQQEFTLPLYSWYPAPVKRYCEGLARTTRPALANYAKYPALNWFSYYSLRDFLAPLGFRCLDRFDLINIDNKTGAAPFLVTAIRTLPLLRVLAHMATPGTYLIGLKSKDFQSAAS